MSRSCSGNAATFYFLLMVLIASVVGLASTVAGIHHLRVWRTESLAAAASAALIAWTLTLLAFGVRKPDVAFYLFDVFAIHEDQKIMFVQFTSL